MVIFKTEENDIICPFCGKYGLVEKFQSKMNGELIYRCYECLGIYESLCDLEYNIQTQLGSGFAKMNGIENFETDAIKLGRLTVNDLKGYNLTFKKYSNEENVHMIGKAYFDEKVIFGDGFQTGDNNVEHLKQP